jgi:hypothetical protein
MPGGLIVAAMKTAPNPAAVMIVAPLGNTRRPRPNIVGRMGACGVDGTRSMYICANSLTTSTACSEMRP